MSTNTAKSVDAEVTKPSLPWHLIDPVYNYAVRDAKGRVWVHKRKPVLMPTTINGKGWMYGGREMLLKDWPDIDPGNCPWRDSLVKRPEGV